MSPDIVVNVPSELARVFVNRVTEMTRQARADGRTLSLALPGGSVADTFLPIMSQSGADWRDVEWFWGDERAVSPEHPDSNFRVAKELFFDRARIDPRRIHRMRGESADIDRAAAEYEEEIVRIAGARPPIDVALLGVGPDGHVCSLFPGHSALHESSRLVLAVTDAPKPPPQRLTLTLPALAGALVVIAAFGASKARVIREALGDPASNLPVALAARSAHASMFLLGGDVQMNA